MSRFARNTVDSLTAIRKLKEHNVECYFEKEGIWTFDSKCEILLTIMSSLAQEESRSISENVTWGQRRRFAEGKVSLPYSHFLGYCKGDDGLPEIVPEEAETVRFIYRSFVEGQTTYMIAKSLTEQGIPTPAGKEKWRASTIESILTNEKYKGAALLQKKFTVDFLTKKRKVNDGEVPQYYVEESHPAIITPEEFDQVQAEFTRRKKMGRQYSGNSVFSAKIVCGDCGCFFGSKIWHSTSKYRRTIWQCNQKYAQGCTTPHLYEDEIKMRFITAFADFFLNRELVLETCRLLVADLSDTSSLDAKIEKVMLEMNNIAVLTKEHIQRNAELPQQQDDYNARYEELDRAFEEQQEALRKLQIRKAERISRTDTLNGFLTALEEAEQPLDYFDENVWRATVERVTIFHDNRMVFQFLDGTEVEA